MPADQPERAGFSPEPPRDPALWRGGGSFPVLDFVRDAIVAANLESGQIFYWSVAATAIFGYSESEGRTVSLEQLVPDECRSDLRAGVAPFCGPGPLVDETSTLELWGRRKSGAHVRVELVLTPFEDASWGGRGVLAVFRDIAARKQSEEERLRDARLDGVHLAVRTMEHHFGSDLAPVVGYLELLANHDALPPDLRRWVEEARQGAGDAMSTLRRLGGLTDFTAKNFGRSESPIIDLDHSHRSA